MSRNAKFIELAERFGGAHDTNYLSDRPELRDFYDGWERQFSIIADRVYESKTKGPIDKPIVYGFVKSFEINARACSFPDADLIVINVGLADYLMILCFVLMSHRKILPWAGDASKESEFQFDVRRGMNDPLWLFENGWRLVPKCERRQRCARLLQQIALFFVFFHELGHVTRGHVDWAQQRGRSAIQEREPILSPSSLDGQALELDADSMAAYDMAKMAFEPTWSQRVHDAVGNTVPFHAPSLFLSFGMQLLFLSLEEGDDWRRSLEGSHPPTAFRRMFAVNAAASFYHAKQPQFVDDFENSAIKGVVEADLAFRILRGEQQLTYRMIGPRNSFVPDWWHHGQNHAERLFEHFKTMAPQLTPLVRRGRLIVD